MQQPTTLIRHWQDVTYVPILPIVPNVIVKQEFAQRVIPITIQIPILVVVWPAPVKMNAPNVIAQLESAQHATQIIIPTEVSAHYVLQ